MLLSQISVTSPSLMSLTHNSSKPKNFRPVPALELMTQHENEININTKLNPLMVDEGLLMGPEEFKVK